MRYSKALNICILLLMAGLSSCIKPKVKTINPEFAIPLATGRLTVADLLAADTSELISVDGDGLMALVYEGGVFQLKGSDFIDIPNTSSEVGIASPIALLAPSFPEGQEVNFGGSQTQNFEIPGLSIDELAASGGLFRIIVTSTFSNDVTVNFNLPTVEKAGDDLDVTVIVPSNTANRESRVKLISLADYNFKFGPNNEIAFNYDVTITSRGQDVNLTDSLIISFKFENVEFKTLAFSPTDLEFDVPKDSIDLKLFANSSSFADIIDFGFFNPTVGLTFENGFGISADLEVQEFKAGGADPANDEDISGVPQIIPIDRPAGPGAIAITSFEVSKENSNIDKVLGPEDRYVKYNFAVKTTQNGSPAFINANSSFAVRAKLNLPLQGFSEGWTLRDTLEVDVSSVDPDLIASASIRLNIQNQFPFELDFQLYVLDGNKQIIDSLINGDINVIPSGTIDPSNGRSTIAVSQRDFPLNAELINNLSKSSGLMFKAGVRTAGARDQPPAQVAIYEDYFMDISIGLRAKVGDNPFGSN